MHAVSFLFPHESAAMAILCWIELGHMHHSSVPVSHGWQDPSFEQLHCLVFEFQAILCDFEMGVSFATLLLSLGLNSDWISCAQRSHPDQHRAQSLFFRRISLAPAARAERHAAIEGARQRQLTCFERASNLTRVRPLSSMLVASTDQ